MNRATLSVLVIACNEAHTIRACLDSVSWTDEIIVLDSGSHDNTVAICREYTDQVIETDWPGFGVQRNRAIEHATSTWVLMIDADERISIELAEEIQQELLDSNYTAYDIPFQSFYLGKSILYGDWAGESHTRLFRRGAGHYTPAPVHEKLIVDGSVKKLRFPILHDSYQDLEEVIFKINLYSTRGAESRFKQGKKTSLFSALGHALWTFTRGYIFKLGFLDGRAGFLLALSNTSGTFNRYVKLLLLQERE